MGLPHSITARYFSSNPSDSGSLRTPCPPASKPAGRRGITPAFGYSAPHPSAGGTLTLLIHALPSAHYRALRPHSLAGEIAGPRRYQFLSLAEIAAAVIGAVEFALRMRQCGLNHTLLVGGVS